MGKVAIICAGLIGQSWAECFAGRGWTVAVYDISPSPALHGKGYQIAASISEAVDGAELVQENGPERLDIKHSLLTEIAAAAGNDTIIASSTSSLLPSILADGNPRAAQILVGHPFNPPEVMPLVEVVPGPQTRTDIVDRAVAIYTEIGKRPVPLRREIPGFVGNRIQKAVIDEAISLVQGGFVSVPDFDAIVRESVGLRWASTGVFAAAHLGGGPGGIRNIFAHIGVALGAVELIEPDTSPEGFAAVADKVEQVYGTADSYAERASDRDRITVAVRDTVDRELASPVLYALDIGRGAVTRIDPGSGVVTDLVTGVLEAPDGLIADLASGTITFTCMGLPDGEVVRGIEPLFTSKNGSVQRIPISGGEPEIVVARGRFTTGKQITVDPGTRRLYWSDREGRGIYRAEWDGSEVVQLVDTAGRGPSEAEEECVGVAVDPVQGFLYWTQKGPSNGGRGRILRAALEMPVGDTARSRDDVEELWTGLPEPIDLDIDPLARMLYWTDRGAGEKGNTLNRAPLPAPAQKGTLPTVLAHGFAEAIGLAIDLVDGVAYVSSLVGGEIRAINLARGTERVVATLPGGATGLAFVRE